LAVELKKTPDEIDKISSNDFLELIITVRRQEKDFFEYQSLSVQKAIDLALGGNQE